MSAALVVWLKSTAISKAVTMSPLAWPVCETFHVIGLALLIGGAGLIDLRLIGAPPATVRQRRFPLRRG